VQGLLIFFIQIDAVGSDIRGLNKAPGQRASFVWETTILNQL
jgi:hypothetical protein